MVLNSSIYRKTPKSIGPYLKSRQKAGPAKHLPRRVIGVWGIADIYLAYFPSLIVLN